MKPSYNIGAKNGLLEQKHFDALGNALWLYLWFLDKQPKDTDKVLGGQPITYEMFASEFGKVSRRTYMYWLKAITDGNYIQTLRTPRGLVITINKPKKWTDVQKVAQHSDVQNSAKQPTSDMQISAHQANSDVQDLSSDVQDLVSGYARIDTSNIKQTKTNKEIQVNSTDVELPTRRGNPEINEMFDYWNEQVGFPIQSRVKQNRYACSSLLKKHGSSKLQQLIRGVAMAHDDRYAPTISDFSSLQSKLNELLVWGKRQSNNKGIEVIS